MDLFEKDYFNNCADGIINTEIYQQLDSYIQHGETTVLHHSVSVAYYSYKIGKKLKVNCDFESLIRGALLHDFFLYDWHVYDKSHRLHGFKHAKTALKNADIHFNLNHTERDIIGKHMWPLNLRPPRYKESFIVWTADKYCSLIETAARLFRSKKRFPQKVVYELINPDK